MQGENKRGVGRDGVLKEGAPLPGPVVEPIVLWKCAQIGAGVDFGHRNSQLNNSLTHTVKQ